MSRHLATTILAMTIFSATSATAVDPLLPPVSGPALPAVEPVKGEDGIYHQSWFVQSFLDLREDHAEARAAGRKLAIVIEQRGCIYCIKMHTDVLSRRYINDYVAANFRIVQLNLWGDREVTDFDGTKLSEKKLAERWAVLFTPSIVFIKPDLAGLEGKWGPPIEIARMQLGILEGTFYDMFAWIGTGSYVTDPSFQRFHIGRAKQRDALSANGLKPDSSRASETSPSKP
ncbi:MAG: thioredoxin [Hyphomicrobium sp.]|nr:MAG: thioredoxin [Hyphomicrobium sp.]